MTSASTEYGGGCSDEYSVDPVPDATERGQGPDRNSRRTGLSRAVPLAIATLLWLVFGLAGVASARTVTLRECLDSGGTVTVRDFRIECKGGPYDGSPIGEKFDPFMPPVNVADPEDCIARYEVAVPMDPAQATTLSMSFGDLSSAETRSIPQGDGYVIVEFIHVFPYEPLNTWSQKATIVETGRYVESITLHL